MIQTNGSLVDLKYKERTEMILRIMMRPAALTALLAIALAGCVSLGLSEPVKVTLAGIEPLEGEGLEARFLAKIRLQNPNDKPVTFDGCAVDVDLNGKSFASGVSDARGEVARFGEGLIEIPITVPGTAIVRQAIGLFTGDRSKATYRVRGFLNTGTFGRVRFDSTGEVTLPKSTPGN